MGMGMPRQPLRQGTSHVVPIVVSAGLAVGVFCGLLFGLGTKRDVLEPSKGGTGAKQSEESQVQAAQVSTGKPVKGTPGTPGAPGTTPAAAGSAGSAAPAVGSAAPAAGSDATASAGSAAAPTPHVGKLTVDVEPETAAAAAKIIVDGKQITGKVAEISFDPGASKRAVKVVIKLPNARDIERTVDVEADADASISFDLKGVKVAPATASGDDGKGAGNAAGGTAGTPAAGGNAGGTPAAGGNAGGNKDGGAGSKDGKAGGNKGNTKGKGKGSSGLIDI
jgi:hypothetical protein